MKPQSISERFYKGLGALTASLSVEDREYALASHILAHEASQRRRKQVLDAEVKSYPRVEALYARRKFGRLDWWGKVTSRITNDNENI